MPYVIIAGLGLAVGAIGGFAASNGTKALSNSVTMAALGVGAVILAKKAKWI